MVSKSIHGSPEPSAGGGGPGSAPSAGRTGGRVTGLVVRRVALADFWWAGVFALADFGGEKLTALAMVPPV